MPAKAAAAVEIDVPELEDDDYYYGGPFDYAAEDAWYRKNPQPRSYGSPEYKAWQKKYNEFQAKQKEARMKWKADMKANAKTQVIHEFDDGWSMIALLNNEAYCTMGEGCMQSSFPGGEYNWEDAAAKNNYRGVLLLNAEGKRQATIVIEWADYKLREKHGLYSGYSKHGIRSSFTPFDDGVEYRLNHGTFYDEKVRKYVAKWVLAHGGELAEGESEAMIGCDSVEVERQYMRQADEAAFAEAFPEGDFTRRHNKEYGPWKGNGWENHGRGW